MKLYSDAQQRLAGTLATLEGKAFDFSQLIELLVSPGPRIRGAPIKIPEIILFHANKPKCAIRYDHKENEVKALGGKGALQRPKLMKFMMSEYRRRRRVIQGGNVEKSGVLNESGISLGSKKVIRVVENIGGYSS